MSSRLRKRKQIVVVTGAGGRLSRALIRKLHRTHQVIAVDRRSLKYMPADVEFYQTDIRRRHFEDLFRTHRIDAVVHLNIMHDPRKSSDEHHDFNILGTKKVFELCAVHRVPKLVLLSSADVYGPHPTNTQFLTEDSPLLGSQSHESIRDLISVDMYATTSFWRFPELETVILRPSNIIGNVDNGWSRYLRLKKPKAILGFDPMIQLIHVDDVVQALISALTPGIRGVYNIGGPTPLPLSHIHHLLEVETQYMPESALRAWMRTSWALKLSHFPTAEIDYIKYICMVDDSRARRDLKYHPYVSIQSMLSDLKTRPLRPEAY